MRTWCNVSLDEQYWVKYLHKEIRTNIALLPMKRKENALCWILELVVMWWIMDQSVRVSLPFSRERVLIPGHSESIKAVLEEINKSNKTGAMFAYSRPREHVTLTSRPVLQLCKYKFNISPSLSLLLHGSSGHYLIGCHWHVVHAL